MEKTIFKKEQEAENEAEICPFCGNVYKIVWLKEGEDYNDFGCRHCPFCGLAMDEYAQLVRQSKQ